jgi:phenylalanyl-tRNA synthetase beta chain
MKISYNWLKDYLPTDSLTQKTIDGPEKLSAILTSVGLEVESLYPYEEIKNSLKDLVIGEVIICEKHPNADKLKITTVNNGKGELLQIVCGAPNVEAGQKVIVAPVGANLFTANGGNLNIKKAKIRGIESNGMICAEDEIGIGQSHEGIIVLPAEATPGMSAFEYFQPYSDWVFEIGLTPNRMDAMSHMGVAKDVCAYLSHRHKAEIKVLAPFNNKFKPDDASRPISVKIENTEACGRYSGVSISGINVAPSPSWLQNKLKSIGVRPINNIVDITNFILHETGQPLHSFDADKINGNKIIVRNLPKGTLFKTLDEKMRTLDEEDIMICDGKGEAMCFGGVFGGIDSGVTENTSNIFLESAWFNPSLIRKTSFRHNLRTEAAIRFEKGVDISNTVNVLKRAALLIKDICGGQISSEIVDEYPEPKIPNEITLQNHYLKKISGKNYHQDTIKNILKSLNFSIIKEGLDEIRVNVPFSNPDITIPADVIEEIMRIDGLDNIEIPATIKMAPAIDKKSEVAALKEKVGGWLTDNGFSEIFTNSITNKKYFDDQTLSTTVHIINSLSEELNVLRPSMLPTGLEIIAYNLNRKNYDLLLFEFGKIYSTQETGKYSETETLSLYLTGKKKDSNWKTTAEKIDIFFVKGICNTLLAILGLKELNFNANKNELLKDTFEVSSDGKKIVEAGMVRGVMLEKFNIKQPVFYININWELLNNSLEKSIIIAEEIPKYPKVERDLSIIIDKSISYQMLENSVNSLKLKMLSGYKLFDVFESEKIGPSKKSLSVNFTFYDKKKTLTDDETDNMMNKIITTVERDLGAEIRRNN